MITISFIIIAYNEQQNISKVIQSVLKQEELNHFEIIVVNDGSIDNTAGIVELLAEKHPQIILKDLKRNRGRGYARNAGLELAKGKYIAFVDADILLPSHWLKKCLEYIKTYDACGGTAVPDGDVAYVADTYALKPKVVSHTTTVTGSNNLFRKEVFDVIKFDATKSNGEDIALGYQIANTNFKTITIPGLIVEHHETKSYIESLKWLFVSGIGASRQFYEHHEIRLPDLAFVGFLVLSLGAIFTLIKLPTLSLVSFTLLLGYLFATSLFHMKNKFYLQKNYPKSIAAVIVNTTLIFAYYIGRFVGMITEWRNK